MSRFVRAIGAVLVVAGAAVLAWAAWMNWGTDISARQQMNEKVSEFESSLESGDTAQSSESGTSSGSESVKRYDDPPDWEKMSTGSTIGILHVPSWNGMKIPVIEGSTQDILDTGAAGHYEGTAGPGEIGNFSLAGHRRTYGSNFRHLDRLKQGDVVILETATRWYVYEWESSEVVDPSHVESIYPVPNEPGVEPTQRLMTMTTCYPEWGNSQRLVAHFVLKYWMEKPGTPDELTEQ